MKPAVSKVSSWPGVPSGNKTQQSPMNLRPGSININVTFPLTMPWKYIGGEEVYLHSFLTSALDSGEWLTSPPPGSYTPEKEPRYPMNRRLGGPSSQTGHFVPIGTRTPDLPASSFVAILTKLIPSLATLQARWNLKSWQLWWFKTCQHFMRHSV